MVVKCVCDGSGVVIEGNLIQVTRLSYMTGLGLLHTYIYYSRRRPAHHRAEPSGHRRQERFWRVHPAVLVPHPEKDKQNDPLQHGLADKQRRGRQCQWCPVPRRHGRGVHGRKSAQGTAVWNIGTQFILVFSQTLISIDVGV